MRPQHLYHMIPLLIHILCHPGVKHSHDILHVQPFHTWNDHIAAVKRKSLPVIICKYQLAVDESVYQFLRCTVKLGRCRLLVQSQIRIHVFTRILIPVPVHI